MTDILYNKVTRNKSEDVQVGDIIASHSTSIYGGSGLLIISISDGYHQLRDG